MRVCACVCVCVWRVVNKVMSAPVQLNDTEVINVHDVTMYLMRKIKNDARCYKISLTVLAIALIRIIALVYPSLYR